MASPAEHQHALLRACLLLRFIESFAYFTLSNIFTLHLTEQLGDAAARTNCPSALLPCVLDPEFDWVPPSQG